MNAARTTARLRRARRGHEVDVLGGTACCGRARNAGSSTRLFVDEASQMSLANVVAVSGCARNIVLLGDPQQLDQPAPGRPSGRRRRVVAAVTCWATRRQCRRSAALFLETTWRMHPSITSSRSELFYEGKLSPVPGLERQIGAMATAGSSGSGLRWVPVEHDGNTNASVEEAERVAASGTRSWRRRGSTRRRAAADWPDRHRALFAVQRPSAADSGAKLPAARVGTVDKFQGQEAPVSIYTMATSRPEDAPRGMEFLYSLNRLNVATSRARALAIVVASPRLLDVVPGSPRQLRMANGLCAFDAAALSTQRG